LAAAFDKIERQARHHVGKRLDRKRRGGAARPSRGRRPSIAPSEEAPSGPAARGPRPRRIVVRPLTVSQAALELPRRAEGFVLFLEARTKRLNVLYRRPDGQLALIEPEA
jgi:hypothetical protein